VDRADDEAVFVQEHLAAGQAEAELGVGAFVHPSGDDAIAMHEDHRAIIPVTRPGAGVGQIADFAENCAGGGGLAHASTGALITHL